MALESVEAVFYWKYSKAQYAACYGRLSGTEYSKDFLQSPSNQFPEIDRALNWASGQIDIEFRWPGGSRPGQWRHSAADQRGQLAWLPSSEAPIPWRVGDPNADVAITIPGDPSRTTQQEANDEYAGLESAGYNPYIMAIKLAHESNTLHVRSYLGNPPEVQEARGIDRLPGPIQDGIATMGMSGMALRFEPSPTIRARTQIDHILKTLKHEPNILLVGPPGCGKSVALEDLRNIFMAGAGVILFDPERWENAWYEQRMAAETKVISLVFHPSYSYENFVAGLVPKGGPGLELIARPGPLMSLAHWAKQGDRKALLLLDEFNRGPAAAIFGDTLALLDRDNRDKPGQPGAWIERPFPHETMEVAPEFALEGGDVAIERRLVLPAGVKIVGALNSTDRSVAPIDAALRRRFAIISFGPDYQLLSDKIGTDVPDLNTAYSRPERWDEAKVRDLIPRVLMVLNERILEILGSDFLLGHALFWHVSGENYEELAGSLAYAFDERVMATLRMTFVDRDEALAAVLAIDHGEPPGRHVGYWREPSSRMTGIAPPRLLLEQLSRIQTMDEVLNRLSRIIM